MKTNLKNLTFNELKTFVSSFNLKDYRTKQIFQWIFQKNITEIDAITSISKDAREKLGEIAWISFLQPEKIYSSKDKSKKYLFQTHDGHGFESVLIPEKKHSTLCISTQIGCPLGCRFCFTGKHGFTRNLSVSEIINQICFILKENNFKDRLPNLVFMGMGEPLLNYANTVKSIQILLNQWGLNFSHRKITVSTAGIIPEIIRLGKDVPVNLAISLNAPNDRIRDFLMPVNKKYPLIKLLSAAKEFPLPPRKRITFEYILIRGINDSRDNARELTRLLKHIPCKINLIPFNEHPGVDLKKPEEKRITDFQKILLNANLTAPIRRSKGSDIGAACGQLGETL